MSLLLTGAVVWRFARLQMLSMLIMLFICACRTSSFYSPPCPTVVGFILGCEIGTRFPRAWSEIICHLTLRNIRVEREVFLAEICCSVLYQGLARWRDDRTLISSVEMQLPHIHWKIHSFILLLLPTATALLMKPFTFGQAWLESLWCTGDSHLSCWCLPSRGGMIDESLRAWGGSL